MQELLQPRDLVEVPRHLEHDLLGHLLDARGDVAVERVERLVAELRIARRRPKCWPKRSFSVLSVE
jgi:hypothetical protein